MDEESHHPFHAASGNRAARVAAGWPRERGPGRSNAEPEPLYLAAKSVRDRYDNISDMTVYRWLRDPRVAFPAPVYIGRRRYWKVADLIAWEQARANTVEVS